MTHPKNISERAPADSWSIADIVCTVPALIETSFLLRDIRGDRERELSVWLALINQLEVLIELGAGKLEAKGYTNKFTPLAALEAVKAALRLRIWLRSPEGILVKGGSDLMAAEAAAKEGAEAKAVAAAFARFRETRLAPERSSTAQQPEHKQQSQQQQDQAQERTGHGQLGSEHRDGTQAELSASASPGTPAEAESMAAAEREATGGQDGAPAVSMTQEGSLQLWWDIPGGSESISFTAQAPASKGTYPDYVAKYTLQYSIDCSNSLSVTACMRSGCCLHGKFLGTVKKNQKCGQGTAQSQQAGAAHREPQRMWRGLSPGAAGEVLHILRPLVYAVLIRRYGRRSWRPWLLALAVELVSSQLTAAAITRRRPVRPSSDTAATEQQEVLRRQLQLLYYLIRSPFYDKITRKYMYATQGILQRIPLVGFFTGKAMDILDGMQPYYTYTAAS